jgi:NADPH-dependent 2,4-dienoyl-CoA reductase/sulfur reductase-like enzyme
MSAQSYSHVIIGAGLAGASAVDGIRELDQSGSILLLGAEPDPPYNRPPLSKQLWTGKEKAQDIFVHDKAFYQTNKVELRCGVEVTKIDPPTRSIADNQGNVFHYEHLLLATGSTPRRLDIPGGDLEGISYFRNFGDYRKLQNAAEAGKSVLVVGGGFIGSEIAAALCMNKLKVSMIFPSHWLVSRVFPESLGKHLTEQYRAKGVEVVVGDAPTSIERRDGQYITRTRGGKEISSDLLVAGIGVTPNISLAKHAGLKTGDGVIVDESLQTSDSNIYAAGDIAFFNEANIGERRIEHWDNAQSQGKQAGRNMAGAREPFKYMPFFFSDLFEFGYEAVGEINSRLETFADWQEENKTGVIYYLDGDRLRGAMMCNVWDKVDAARALIQKSERVSHDDLRGAIQ